ncbi:MAG: Rpn family recombination-promoting nuclease/putative transposase [Xanthomonadales bacterium]|jgi:predicted transposase YdaD|nr:Rpn family recombination-promoting nuclease/putative transposase [Xanthomonadales bacterium]
MQNDASYKKLFSHAELVADLLRTCIRESWIHDLDFASLERVSGSHVDRKLQQRHSDVIWRLRWAHTGQWVYVYLLLEFQSKPDRWMAIRMLNYVALFYDHLLQTKALKANEALPLVLPIVLYNGEPRWRKPLSLKALRGDLSAEVERHQPELVSVLIDQGRFLADQPQSDSHPTNLTTLLFRLDQAEDLSALAEAAQAVSAWLKRPEQQHLAATIGLWLKHVLLPPMAADVEWAGIEDFEELTDMLQERARRWPERWRQEGRQEGRIEGRLETLVRLTRKRFGTEVALQTQDRLVAVTDSRRLEELEDAFLECSSGEQWLERSGRLAN